MIFFFITLLNKSKHVFEIFAVFLKVNQLTTWLNVKDQMCTTVNEEKCSTVVDQECRIVDDKQCRYNGRPLDQYNKDDVSLISNKIFFIFKENRSC